MEDTIAAVATATGKGGLSVVRLSGPGAVEVVGRCFRPARCGLSLDQVPSHTVHFGVFIAQGRSIDEVLVTVLRKPRTYTREDVVEVSCHGGALTARLILEALLTAGARAAGPGEFTQRAFLNGRIDLAQAEAVADVIQAKTEWALLAAQDQLAGGLSGQVNSVRDDLLRMLAQVEAHLDFPDEDLPPENPAELAFRIRRSREAVVALLQTARQGQIVRQGLHVSILGRPNVGKSSLLNALLGRDRAIVSPAPGTTRDTIEETADVAGIPVVFIDTAGLRAAPDPVEHEGIRRTRAAAMRAELVLHVFDVSQPAHPEDGQYLAEFASRPRLLVLNKTDLPRCLQLPPTTGPDPILVSCRTGEGMDVLRGKIRAHALDRGEGEGTSRAMINARHEDALRRGQEALTRALEALSGGLTPELVALELRAAVNAVGEVVGKTVGEGLLDAVFSQFCIGK